MVPMVILPVVPLVAIGTIGSLKTEQILAVICDFSTGCKHWK